MKNEPKKADSFELSLLRDLIALDTINPPGNELRAAQYLQRFFEAHGIACQVQQLGANRANLIAQIGSEGPMLEFCGHLDVVPAEGTWRHPPLEMTQEAGLLYGRGTCDMKGGVAAMCAAAVRLKEAGRPLRGRLRLVFVADEEHANQGMLAHLAAHEPADWAVIGEPTDLNVAIAHRGVARHYIDLLGSPMHAALPTNGHSAVLSAARAILAIEELNQVLSRCVHEVLPPPSIVVTQVQGYEKDNIIPGRVRLLTDYRLHPGCSEAQAKQEVDNTLRKAGLSSFELSLRLYLPGGEIAGEDEFTAMCCKVAEQTLEKEMRPVAFGASCEQCFLLSAGTKTVICGPGSLAQAHTKDEYLELTQLERAVDLYERLARKLLMEE